MKVQKVVSVSGDFAKKGEDINYGDVVTILDEGQKIEGQFGEQFVIKIKTKAGEDKNVNFNQTTINILVDEFGDDTVKWVGEQVIIRGKKDTVGGKKVDIYYFVTSDWDFDEYRDLVKSTDGIDESAPNPEDVPF